MGGGNLHGLLVVVSKSGLRSFFTSKIHRKRPLKRWKAELLQYHFMIVHRMARRLTEWDALTWYNKEWQGQCQTDMATPAQPLDSAMPTTATPTVMNVPICFAVPTNPTTTCKSCSPLAEIWYTTCQVLNLNGIGGSPILAKHYSSPT